MAEIPGQVTFEVQLQQEAEKWNDFFGEARISERAIADAKEVVDSLKNLGWKNLVAIPAQDRDFPQDASYPGWKVKPQRLFYDLARAGRISGEPTRINGGIAIFDTTPKPDYTDGTQMYDDPESFQGLLADQRRNGAIKITDWTHHVPETSRLGISPNEYESVVFPALMEQADLSGMVAEGRTVARLPKFMELNVYGNQYAPH